MPRCFELLENNLHSIKTYIGSYIFITFKKLLQNKYINQNKHDGYTIYFVRAF